MVEASQHFWTDCAEGFSESPRQKAQGQETRLADPRCSTQDVCKKKKKKKVTGVHKHCYSTSCTQIQQHCIIKNLKILNRMSCRHWIRTFLVAFPLFIQHKQLIKQRILSQCITDCNSICFIWISTADYSMF